MRALDAADLAENRQKENQNPMNGTLSKTELSHPRGSPQKLSSFCGKNQGNDPSFHRASTPKSQKIFGRFYSQTWYPKDREQKQKKPRPTAGLLLFQRGHRRALRHHRHDGLREYE
jgi:hypothetical protein